MHQTPADQVHHAEDPLFRRFSQRAATATGSARAFTLAAAVILVWAASGPAFRFSDTWQLVINTGTTIVTFLMVFLIQDPAGKRRVCVCERCP